MSDIITLYNKFQNDQTDDNLQEFYKGLSVSIFLIPFKVVDGNENLITIQDRNNTIYFPVFTDFKAVSGGVLNTLDEEIKFAEVTVKEIDDILRNNSTVKAIALNPYDINVVINKEVIQSLYSLNDSSKVIFGVPAEDTTTVENKLSAIFSDMQKIERAYFAKIIIRKTPSYLVVVKSFDKLTSEVFKSISKEIVHKKIHLDFPLDMISADTELGKDIMLSQEPFYVKKWLKNESRH